MKTLIGNEVTTRYSAYTFGNREQAEAFYFIARDRSVNRELDARRLLARDAPRPGASLIN